MLRVSKFRSRAGRLGQPLDTPFPIFDVEGVKFRYGGTSMIAGMPGSFKSILALNMMIRWADMGHDSLYLSADSDEYTVARRCAGIMTGVESYKVETDFEVGAIGKYLPSLRSLDDKVLWEYRALEMEQIYDRLHAYADGPAGGYPDVVFLDNLINFAPSTDDWGFMRDMTNQLDALARETKSHVCVLHHASENAGSMYDHATGKFRPRTSIDPVPRSAIQGKITQIPRLVLTTAANSNADPNLMVACVKNTNGKQYPEADHIMRFNVADSLRVSDDYRRSL